MASLSPSSKRKHLIEFVFTLVGIGLLAAVYLRFGCPFRLVFGVSCPGCGMTRALRALLCLDFRCAWQYHPLVFLLPVLGVWFLFALQGKRLPAKPERVLILITVILFFAVYIFRFVQNDPVVKPDFSSSVLHNILS